MDQKQFSDSDITFAAFLWTRGIEFVGLKSNPHRSGQQLFVFNTTEKDFREMKAAYLNDGVVPAKEFYQNWRTLRKMVSEASEGNHGGTKETA